MLSPGMNSGNHSGGGSGKSSGYRAAGQNTHSLRMKRGSRSRSQHEVNLRDNANSGRNLEAKPKSKNGSGPRLDV